MRNKTKNDEVKVTWDRIYEDFALHFPNLHKKTISWRPFGFATIEVHTQGDVNVSYNYDTKQASLLPEKKIKITEEQDRKIRERMDE